MNAICQSQPQSSFPEKTVSFPTAFLSNKPLHIILHLQFSKRNSILLPRNDKND